MHLHGTSRVNEKGHLEIGGCDTVHLAHQFGTPLYIYDESHIRQQCRQFIDAFKSYAGNAQVAYASKAFSTVAMCQLVEEEGLLLDVVSGGELYTALQANYPAHKIHFHGNNKTVDELEMALDAQIGCFIVDNFYELKLLHDLAFKREQKVNILLRVSPGVEAHTHEYITTGQEDSKFGFDLGSGQVHDALRQAVSMPYLDVLGLHSHIGSQIFDTTAFKLAIEKIASFIKEMSETLDWQLSVFNVGGGFGIRYTHEDSPLPIHTYVEAISEAITKAWNEIGQPLPEIWIEPGRSIVGEAGTTLYSVGAQKEVPNIRQYVSVDGGMSDNIRVALYQAQYDAYVANRMNEGKSDRYTVAGKLCETGDLLIKDIDLPKIVDGDLLAVTSTGAYGYSMASNYNRMCRPGVVFVKNNEATLVVKRETYDDLIRNDLPLKSHVIK